MTSGLETEWNYSYNILTIKNEIHSAQTECISFLIVRKAQTEKQRETVGQEVSTYCMSVSEFVVILSFLL